MKAVITGENDELVGVNLLDNNDAEHVIEMRFNGEITAHQQDGYPDDGTKRSRDGNEHVTQARRLAKLHVYRERGYDTLTPYENPDRIIAAAMAILDLPEVKLEHYFGDLEATIRRHHENDELDLPFEDADPDDVIVYRKDIWLEQDPTEIEPPLLDRFCEYVEEPLETLDAILSDGPDPRESLPEYDIEAVSDMHYLHSTGVTNQEQFSEQPLDREPDARIEVMPVDLDAFDSFEEFLASHLVNQVRDCFVEMGLEPPEPFQVQGLGKYESMVKQQLMPMYERYYQAGVPVDSWDPAE